MKSCIRLWGISLLILVAAWAAAEIEPNLTIDIPMRDGAKLPTDIYLPNEGAKNLPCILIRSPSGKRFYHQGFLPLKDAGYVVAIQDCRSFCDKEGKTFPYLSDGWLDLKDGYDAVEWLAKSELTNGKVGTLGFSAMGITQLFLAPSKPPSLVCQHMGFVASNLYRHTICHGGKVKKSQVEGWLGRFAKDPSVISAVHQQSEKSDFWSLFNTTAVSHQAKVPTLIYGGWYDTFIEGTIDAYLARPNRKLIIGPWTHHWPHNAEYGDFFMPKEGLQPPYDFSPQAWFDYHLKGRETGVAKLPEVLYYVLGPLDGSLSSGNVWKEAKSWPVPSTPTHLYLTHDGKMTNEASGKRDSLPYRFDPNDPVPTIGGRNLFLGSGPKDQRPIEKREDVLIFTTDPLEKDLEAVGKVIAVVYLSTDRLDTDVSLRLTDVYPDGKSILITDGIRRLQHANENHQHEAVPVEVELDTIGQVFAKGHRIRLSISGSNYPRYELNSNNPGKNVPVTANNRVHFGRDAPSRLILPVVK